MADRNVPGERGKGAAGTGYDLDHKTVKRPKEEMGTGKNMGKDRGEGERRRELNIEHDFGK